MGMTICILIKKQTPKTQSQCDVKTGNFNLARVLPKGE